MTFLLQFGGIVAAFIIFTMIARILGGGCLVSPGIGLLGAVVVARLIFMMGGG